MRTIKSPISITFIFLCFILLVSDYNFRWKNEQWKEAIHTDAADYYRYLPMVFINHEFDKQEDNPDAIKYFVGTSILYLPFFAIACAGSFLFGLPIDGYSMLFPIFISIGTMFYFMFGLYYLSKFLKYYISRTWVIPLVLTALTFGTIAFYYTVNAPGWAHIVAFALICFLLYHFKKILVDYTTSSIIAIIAALSFLFFIRPTDVTIIFIAPFLATDWRTFFDLVKKIFTEKKTILLGLILALIPLMCQLGVYKVYTGNFIIWSYTKEGFHFLHPEIFNELFSYSKGFFIYTPICFLSLFGLFRLYKINRYLFFGVILYLALNIYIISSWWCWNYGCSYGPRAFIEHYPLFFLLLAILLDVKNSLLKILTIALIAFFCFLNLFQIYQGLNGILDLDIKTDKKGYWDVFLSTEKGYSGKFYRIPVDERKENIVSRKVWFNDMEKKDSAWLNPHSQSNKKSHSGSYSGIVNKDIWYSIGLRKYLTEIPYNKNVLIRASGWFFVPEKRSNSYFAFSFVSNGKNLYFQPFKLDGYTQNFNTWEYHVFEIHMPKFSKKIEQDTAKQIEFYYFNNSNMDCFVDDLSIEFIEYKKINRVLDLSWE